MLACNMHSVLPLLGIWRLLWRSCIASGRTYAVLLSIRDIVGHATAAGVSAPVLLTGKRWLRNIDLYVTAARLSTPVPHY